jgi:hypothetical protein
MQAVVKLFFPCVFQTPVELPFTDGNADIFDGGVFNLLKVPTRFITT